jgi:hypothetical protein
MEIDFDALDQVISQRRPSQKTVSRASSLKTPKYIDVIQAGAIKKPLATARPVRKSSTMRKVKRVVAKKVEKVEKPAASIADLIDRELESGDTTIGDNLLGAPEELNVDDLVAYAEDAGITADTPDASQMSQQDVAEDFLSNKHELVPFLPNVKVEKTPLSGDVPATRPVSAAERISKSERELASELIKDDLVADKEEIKEKEEKKKEKEKERDKARILTEERMPAKKPKKEKFASTGSPKKTSTTLIVMLGILIAVFGAVAGAFIYLITAD